MNVTLHRIPQRGPTAALEVTEGPTRLIIDIGWPWFVDAWQTIDNERFGIDRPSPSPCSRDRTPLDTGGAGHRAGGVISLLPPGYLGDQLYAGCIAEAAARGVEIEEWEVANETGVFWPLPNAFPKARLIRLAPQSSGHY